MKINDIRKKLAYDPKSKPSHKAALRAWLNAKAGEWPVALTLTVEQTIRHKNANGEFYCRTTVADCEALAKRFMHKLNKEIYGHAATRHGKGLRCFAVVEGERSGKRLHLHFALGKLPCHVKYNQIESYIVKAKSRVEGIDEQHKLDIADSGWLEYITKEVGTKDTESVLWELM